MFTVEEMDEGCSIESTYLYEILRDMLKQY